VLAGQINAMRIYQADLFILQKKQYNEQINLVDLSRQSVTMLRDSLIYHRETAQNTAVLYEINDRLVDLVNRQNMAVTDPLRARGLLSYGFLF